MNDHPTDDVLALYVMDAMDADEAAALESHVSLCAACEARLAREAKLEIALAQVGAAGASSPPRARRPNLRWGFAAAAALLFLIGGARLLLSSNRSASNPSASAASVDFDAGVLAIRTAAVGRRLEMAVACLDPSQLEECLKSSRAQGRMVQLPAQPVPKYEELAQDDPRPAALGAWHPLVEGE